MFVGIDNNTFVHNNFNHYNNLNTETMKTINTTKTRYVRIDGWRGYSEPINAVGGCNDTGTFSDSPCPSDVAKREIDEFKAILRKNKIRYRSTSGGTSNVFCGKRYVCVHEDDRELALELATEHRDNTRLFYPIYGK